MKKNILFLLLSFLAYKTFAQSICVSVDCKSTFQLPLNYVPLNSQVITTDSLRSIIWKQIAGSSSAIISNDTAKITTVSNINNSGTYIFSCTATTVKSASA